jgi:NAD(P)-dependent dehydrogenase (short-subunit alcohol dehydrogenase family)
MIERNRSEGLLAGRVAVVTGASRGIGAAIAERFAAEGASVVATARSMTPSDSDLDGSLAEVVERIAGRGGKVEPVVADLGDATFDRGEIIRTAQKVFGRPVQILVNNAASARGFEYDYADMPRRLFEAAIEVNIWAAWELAQLTIPGMREQGAGWILNISSGQAAPRPGPPFAAHQHGGACLYGATKAMIDRLTTGAAMDLYGDNIAVNALAPERGIITPHSAKVATIPVEHSEPLETFAEAALALCSGDPKLLTGRVVFSLSLLKELDQAVRTLDREHLLAGWQPTDLVTGRPHYLAGSLAG